MPEQYLEIGKITNTHGVMGEVRVQPGPTPRTSVQVQDPVCGQDHCPLKVERARVHKNMVILKLEASPTCPAPWPCATPFCILTGRT
mgnify:CR=1 FL=1